MVLFYTGFISILVRFCRKLLAIDTLWNPFLELASTEQRVQSFFLKETTAYPWRATSVEFLPQGNNGLSLAWFEPMLLEILRLLVPTRKSLDHAGTRFPWVEFSKRVRDDKLNKCCYKPIIKICKDTRWEEKGVNQQMSYM